MATVNSVQNGLHLPLNGITTHPRVLMCSASLGSEGSVTLQLHEAIDTSNSDSTASSSSSSTGISTVGGGSGRATRNSNLNSSSLDTALTAIGYPDPDLIADVLGTLQAAAAFSNSNTMLSTTNQNIGVMCKTQKISTSSAGSNGSIILSRNNNSNSNSPPLCGQIVSIDTRSKTTKIVSSVPSTTTTTTRNIVTPPNIITTTTPITTTRRSRPKTSSPTRHGPQQCQVCNKIFGNASALAKHKLTHSDERKYVCVMCTKAFKRQDHLNGHMLTHRNKKPYECKAEGCGKSYCDARSLRRHTENHHQGLVSGAGTGTGSSTTNSNTATISSAISTAVITAKTPNNLSLMSSTGAAPIAAASSTGPPTGLSLSPATANGDANSPGASASCIQYTINGEKSKPSSPRSSSTGSTTSTFSSSSSSSSVSSSSSSTSSPLTSLSLATIPASISSVSSSPSSSTSCVTSMPTTSATTQTALVTSGNEGLTKQQLDLISQIMQQTKQGVKQVTVSTTSGNSSLVNATSSLQNINNNNGLKNGNIQQQQQQQSQNLQQQQQQPQQQQQQHLIQRPRTWNMQQTTQLKQNQMKISAMSLETVGTITSDMKPTTNVIQQHNQLQTHHSQQILNIVKIENKPVECNLCHRKFKNIPALNGHMRLHGGYFKKDAEPKKAEKKENSGPPLQTASVGVRALIEEKIINKRCKDLKGAFVVPAPPITTSNSTMSTSSSNDLESFLTPKSPMKPSVISANQHKLQKISTTNQGTSTRVPNTTKDATLIELLKRGTKVAIKRATPEPSSAPVPTTSPLSITLANGERAPVALTIQQSPTGSTDVFTLTYSADSPAFNIADSEVYADATMLLQAVDSIEILQNGNGATTSGTTTTEQINDIRELSEFAFTDSSSGQTKIVTQEYTTSSKELQDILNNSYPLHSKDFIIYNNNNNNNNNSSVGDKMTVSPLPSPIGYPTPPASQEAVAQTSPFLDDSHHFSDAASSFFEESKPSLEYFEEASRNYYNSTNRGDSDDHLTEDEKILKLKTALEDEHIGLFKTEIDSSPSSDNFDISVKVEDLLNDATNGDTCDFSDQNLSFLDDPDNFLDDDGNPTSPLSESFFASDEVKEVLKDVLPPSSSNQPCDDSVNNDADMDLFYLPSLTLQSQMMSTSDDPLLSSSPREFGQQRLQQFTSPSLTNNTNINNNSIESYNGPSNNKKLRTDEYIPLIMTTPENTSVIQPPTTNTANSNANTNATAIASGAVNPSTNDEFMGRQNNKQQSIDNSVRTSMEAIINSRPSVATTTVVTGSSTKPTTIYTVPHPPPTTTNSILKRRLRQGSYQGYVMPKKQEVFKSRLRRPSSTHYTPGLMLNPDRKAGGLFSNLPRVLLHPDILDLSDEFEQSSCINLANCFLDDSKVNIGTAYQATIPPLLSEGDENNNRPNFFNNQNVRRNNNNNNCMFSSRNQNISDDVLVDDEKIWDPAVQSDDKLLARFIELSKSSAIPLGYHSEEVALNTLYKSNGDTHVAVLELLQKPSEISFKWRPIEIEIFLKGIEKHGKDFYKISKEIQTKTSKDCVQLYYFWKKICGDYKSTHLRRDEPEQHPSGSSSSVFAEPRPFVCEMPDCSASFTSKGALHSHTRIHGRNGLPGFNQIASTSGFLTK